MILDPFTGEKITANQLAKVAIADRLNIVEYFMENHRDEWKQMTEKEQQDYGYACDKRVMGLLKYLGVDHMGRKLK